MDDLSSNIAWRCGIFRQEGYHFILQGARRRTFRGAEEVDAHILRSPRARTFGLSALDRQNFELSLGPFNQYLVSTRLRRPFAAVDADTDQWFRKRLLSNDVDFVHGRS